MAKGFFNRILDAVGLEEEEFENDEVMDEQEDYYEERLMKSRKRNSGSPGAVRTR